MKDETLPAQRLEHATSKLQDALSALKLAGEELAIVEASMIGDDAHRRLIMESSAVNPIGTADDITSHRALRQEWRDKVGGRYVPEEMDSPISDDEILSNAREVRRALTDKTADALQAAEGGQA